MSTVKENKIYELVPLIENINIKYCAHCAIGVREFLAIVTSDGDIILHYTYLELNPVLKRVPWFSDSSKTIQAICFDVYGIWLLVACSDCSLCIIPALNLVDQRQPIDCKWSLTDLTHFPKHPQTPASLPTCLIWWQTSDCNQNALVGFENGAIAMISLTDGRCLATCSIPEAVKELQLMYDHFTPAFVALLINGCSGQQWRLFLEHKSNGYIWPPEFNNPTDESTRSRLYNLKQLGVDKLVSLKQRLSEARGHRRDSQNSDTASESSHSECTHPGPEMLPHLCDTFFELQHSTQRTLLAAFYQPTSLLTVHSIDVEAAPLFVYKLPQDTSSMMLTECVMYTINTDRNMVSILSRRLSECRLEGDSEFNTEAILAQFPFENSKILYLRRIMDTGSPNFRKTPFVIGTKKASAPLHTLPKFECYLERPMIDTCHIITNNSIYKISIKITPILQLMHSIIDDKDLETAERLSVVYDLKMPYLLEKCGDILIAQGSYHSGIILYKQAKVHLLKRVLKLALVAECQTLLKFIHLCLNSSKVDMSVATKIHIGNLAVMAYTELILRFFGYQRTANSKDFMNFLCCEEYYDQVLAVNVACQAGHWNIVTLLAKSRGLHMEAVTAISQILQNDKLPKHTEQEFLYALSESSLTQSLLISDQNSQVIFQYIRTNVDTFPIEILKRLIVQLDPSQPEALPLTSKIFHTAKCSSGLDSTIESVDMENPDKTIIVVKDFIDTFLCVAICLTSKTDKLKFELGLLQTILLPDQPVPDTPIKKLPDLRPLSCGFEHAAVIRNSDVYTMGASTSGCLGLGPLLCTSSPPKLVKTLSDLKVKVLSVSCGRKHTLALTDFGVYVWGSNTFCQLGLGVHIVDTPYPKILPSLASLNIVDVWAGQYHSIALTSSGKVYTWGWGIHGQLGHGRCNNECYPKLLNFSEPVKQVAAGHAHTLILTTEGKLYGFGSNYFGQLEGYQFEMIKTSSPMRLVLQPEIYSPVEKVATAYFHNVAVNSEQEVYTWGASPQEVRIFQSKNTQQKQSGVSESAESWKLTLNIFSATDNKPVEQIAVGYRHTAVLHNGRILWGRSRDEELCSPKLRQKDKVITQKLIHVSCGWDYTMAIDHCGKLLAWGSNSMATTLLGRQLGDENRRFDGKVVVFKNTKRVVRFPHNNSGQGTTDNYPIEVPGLPAMAITFSQIDQKSLLNKVHYPFAVFKIENEDIPLEINPSSFDHLYQYPRLKFGQKTLHYCLETYYGFYDFENILAKCLEIQNYQAAAKIAMLNGHFGDSLGFQLRALKRYLESLDLSLIEQKDGCEKDVELIVRSMQDLNEKNLIYSSNVQSPAHILSTSSSLDSIRQWGDDLEHQGGLESPCEFGDIRHNITQYVQSLKSDNDNSPPISSVSKIVAENDGCEKKQKLEEEELTIKDKHLIKAIEAASCIVEFYIKKIYTSENHILMQNILMKCIEFWLANNLPVVVLETILLKNMDKYFYPLSVLLFCKNFEGGSDDSLKKPASGFLKEFSTKFCLQLCSMVLDNVTKT